ncbi:putative sugar O-methyltransferase, partial [Poseidonibacter sp.]|uniref:putative sugar O-methyltransferase n=1 Tax=Poseidonibacter sp. TaxID=2321188 RepID=UPI003C72F16A
KQNMLLENMLKDMQKQEDIYKPTSFWQAASKTIIKELNENKIENFRSLFYTRSMFVPNYAMPTYLDNRKLFDKTKEELKIATDDIKSAIKLERAMTGETQAFSDYRVLKSSNKNFAPFTDKVSESSIGNPIEQFNFDNRKFSRSFLNYLLGINFIKQHIHNPIINTVMEIGGGFGTLGEILLGDERNNCFYINADIPPVSFVSSYYLKEVFGDKNIADYEDLKECESLDINTLKNEKKAINITSWQVPKLKGEIDLFVNFISFQEMEPNVVNNYCKYITTLNPKYILLRNIEEGKRVQSDDYIYGVKEPIRGEDYDTFLSQYELVATDNSIFGFKTEDDFHSQLRLYEKLDIN